MRGGLSGARFGVVSGTPGLFVKWEGEGGPGAVVREGVNLERFRGVPGVTQLVLFDPSVPLLVTTLVEPEVEAVWDDARWDQACAVLRAVSGAARVSGLPLITESPFFADRGVLLGSALSALLPRDRALARAIARSYEVWRGSVFPASEVVVAHGDAHDENWLLTRSGVVLLDFECLRVGPRGFDEVFLLAHLPVPLDVRLGWLGSACVRPDVSALVSGAVAARLAVGVAAGREAWRSWCGERWYSAVSLARALL